MRLRILAVMLLFSFLGSMTVLARSQAGQRVQSVTIEISINEITGAQPDEIAKIASDRDRFNRLKSEGKVLLLADLHMRTKTGEPFTARVGQRVPIQTGSLPEIQTTGPTRQAAPPGQLQSAAAFSRIEYENTGLVVEGTASLAGEGMLDIRLKIEMSGLDRSSGTLTPTFTQRTFSDVIRMKENETAMLTGLTQAELQLSPPAGGSGSAPSRGGFVVLITTRSIL